MKTPYLDDIASHAYVTISETLSISEALSIMRSKGLREVIVLRDSIHPFGLLTTQALIAFKLDGVDFSNPLSDLKLENINSISKNGTLLEAFEEIQDSCHCLVLLDEERRLCGYLTYTDIISSIDPSVLMQDQKIRDILWETFVRHTSGDTPAIEVLRLLNIEGFESIIIYDDERAAGIVTNKDIVRILNDKVDLKQPIERYMSAPLKMVNENVSVKEALEYIQRENYKRIIVCNDKRTVIGQISQSELLAKVYSRWAHSLKQHDNELEGLNKILQRKAENFEKIAQLDKLTGVVNRSKFESTMLSEIERCRRYSDTFSIVFLDIDHFKSVNDTFGHLVGDSVLREVSKVIKSQTRNIDLVARWGGEEFVVILPKTKQENAFIVAEKFRKSIAEYTFEKVNKITCSFGVSQFEENDTITSIIHKADSAMYLAKSNGRNQVRAYR